MSSRAKPLAGFLRPALAILVAVAVVAASGASTAQTTRPGRSTRAEGPAASGKGDAKARSKTAANDPAAKADRPPNFLGDPKRFTRFGGWGSMGGAIGQFGFARSMLIMMPPVQQELKLTAEQKEKIRLWQEESRERGEEWGRKMREQNGENGDPFRQNDMPLAARIMQFTSIMSQVTNLAKEGETTLARILDADQRKRLNQIALQMQGLSALRQPEVAEALNLDEDQLAMIQQTLTQAQVMQMTTWLETGRAMSRQFGRGPRPGADGGPPQAGASTDGNPPTGERAPAPRGRTRSRTAAKKAADEAAKKAAETPQADAPAPADDPNQAAAGASPERRRGPTPEQQRQFSQQFESMRERTDRIQEQAVREISRILTKRQKAQFDKMLGPPFDPTQITTMGRPPGAGRRGTAADGGPAAPADGGPPPPKDDDSSE